MRRVAIALLVLAAAGCGSGGAVISKQKLPSLVLAQRDLGSAYGEFVNSRQGRADVHPGPRSDPQRFGRIGGWISRYRHVGGSLETKGPLVVESRADLFGSTSSAKKDLEAYIGEYQAQVASLGGTRREAPEIGAAAVAFSYGSGADNFYVVAWRDANVTAAVVIEGAHVELRDAAALARKQEARIARAR